MEDRFDRLERKLDDKFAKVDEKFAKVDEQFAKVDEQFAKVDEKLAAVGQQITDLSQRVGVQHEDVKADFRFALEALGGTEEQINARITRESEGIKAMIAPLAAAVKHLTKA